MTQQVKKTARDQAECSKALIVSSLCLRSSSLTCFSKSWASKSLNISYCSMHFRWALNIPSFLICAQSNLWVFVLNITFFLKNSAPSPQRKFPKGMAVAEMFPIFPGLALPPSAFNPWSANTLHPTFFQSLDPLHLWSPSDTFSSVLIHSLDKIILICFHHMAKRYEWHVLPVHSPHNHF